MAQSGADSQGMAYSNAARHNTASAHLPPHMLAHSGLLANSQMQQAAAAAHGLPQNTMSSHSRPYMLDNSQQHRQVSW